MKAFVNILLIAFVVVSCEREVVFDGQMTTPLVVVNSYATPDSVLTAQVSLSRFFLKDSIEYKKVENADLNLWVNGVLKEKMLCAGNGVYKSTYKPTVADQLKLTADVPQMQQVVGTTSFVAPTMLLSVDTQKVMKTKQYITTIGNDTIGIALHYKVNYKLRFKDDGTRNNYYRLIVRIVRYTCSWNYNTEKIDTIVDGNSPQYPAFDFTDVVSGNVKDPLADTGTSPVGELLSDTPNTYNVFSDEMFNGKTYALKFSTDLSKILYFSPGAIQSFGAGNILKNEIYISLQSITKEYYLYLKTRSASKATNYFSEPVQVYTNIKGGVGILGSYTVSNVLEIAL